MLCHEDNAVVTVVGIITRCPALAVLISILVPVGALEIVHVEMLVALLKWSIVFGVEVGGGDGGGTGVGLGVGVGVGEGTGVGVGAGAGGTLPVLNQEV